MQLAQISVLSPLLEIYLYDSNNNIDTPHDLLLILERKLLTATDDSSGRVMLGSKHELRSCGGFHCHSRNVPAIPDGTTLKMLSKIWDDYSYPKHVHINTHRSSLHKKTAFLL